MDKWRIDYGSEEGVVRVKSDTGDRAAGFSSIGRNGYGGRGCEDRTDCWSSYGHRRQLVGGWVKVRLRKDDLGGRCTAPGEHGTRAPARLVIIHLDSVF